MKYVLDSCAAIEWVLPEPDTPEAVQVRTDFLRGQHDLPVADRFAVEVALAPARPEREGIIARPFGARRLRIILASLPILHPYLPLLSWAFALAALARMGVYDRLYVAPAEREGCPLLTADDRLVRALGPSHPFIRSPDSI